MDFVKERYDGLLMGMPETTNWQNICRSITLKIKWLVWALWVGHCTAENGKLVKILTQVWQAATELL